MLGIVQVLFLLTVYSVFASILFEIFAGLYNLRGRLLYSGIRNFSDEKGDFIKNFYTSKEIKDSRVFSFFNKPAYIPSEIFANEVRKFLKKIKETNNQEYSNDGFCIKILDLENQSEGSNEKTKQLLIEYFNYQILTIRAKYKAIARIGLFATGFILACLLNLDFFLLISKLDFSTATTIPEFSGWFFNSNFFISQSIFSSFTGCTITAILISFGAPYWFDIMQKFARVKI
ncbi:MAG: hypothetical protein JXR58_05480 [Bacteroidales bacterium]|nr:hypothetical protein [Bacteroidales bacterium]